MPNRKIVVYAGTSADGFIARPDGDIEWLKLLSAGEFADGVVQLHYEVEQPARTNGEVR